MITAEFSFVNSEDCNFKTTYKIEADNCYPYENDVEFLTKAFRNFIASLGYSEKTIIEYLGE